MPHDPSIDPNRTATHPGAREAPSPDTLDATGAGTTPPSARPGSQSPPDSTPVIPGYAITAELAGAKAAYAEALASRSRWPPTSGSCWRGWRGGRRRTPPARRPSPRRGG